MSGVAIGAAFVVQLILGAGAFVVAPRVERWGRAGARAVCAGALVALLLWPLMRVFPAEPIALLGAPAVACVELTGLAIPAVLFFSLAARRVPKASDRRAILLLTAVAAVYFVRAGWWMISPGVSDLDPLRIDSRGICRQTTGYTCVAASMVTMLRANGVEATEEEMARLAHVEVGGGATDSRAIWALERRLAGTGLRPRYCKTDYAGLIAAPKPCLVQIGWGYFMSHMVPVMSADSERVVLGDPECGKREMTAEAFGGTWKGTVIAVERD